MSNKPVPVPGPVPLPRDSDDLSFSELVPFRSKKIKLYKSPIVYFVAVTAVFNVLLFGLRVAIIRGTDVDAQVAAFDLVVQVTLFYMLALAVLGVHAYAKSDKSLLYYAFPAVFVYVFMRSPLWGLIYVPFDVLASGDLMETSKEWPVRLYSAICGPGLREELVKALPALIGAAITVAPARFGWLPERLRKLWQVRGPLDGVLMGFAAGAAFLFAETGGQYIHNALIQSMKMSHGNLAGAFGDGLMLLMPRVMNGWVGHMAWSAIVGYAIGLAVVRRRQALKILLVGWGAAAVLHGLWDSDAPGDAIALYAIGGVGGLLAISCLVKARQLESSLFGRAQETFGSIVVGMPGNGYAPVPAAPHPGAQLFTPQGTPQGAQPGATPVVPTPIAPIPVSPTPAAAPTLVPAGLALILGATRLPLTNGRKIDFGREAASGGKGQGIIAEVTQHPTRPDLLGLKNIGATTWYATLRDGTVQPVPVDRSLRLAAGVTIDFGTGLVASVAAA